MTWRYYKLPVAGGGHFFVRIDEEREMAEWCEADSSRWVRQDAYFGEVYVNGQGSPCLATEALAAVPA